MIGISTCSPDELTDLLSAINEVNRYLVENEGTPSYDADVKQSHASLVQTVYNLCIQILPAFISTVSLNSKLVRSLNLLSKLDGLLWVGTLKLYGQLARWSPTAALSTWSLFLGDSNATDQAISKLVCKTSTLCVEGSTNWEISHYVNELSVKSPVFGAALFAQDSDIRIEAVKCIHALVHRLPLQQWFMVRPSTVSSAATVSPSMITGPSSSAAAAKPTSVVGTLDSVIGSNRTAPLASGSISLPRSIAKTASMSSASRKSSNTARVSPRSMGFGDKVCLLHNMKCYYKVHFSIKIALFYYCFSL